MANITNNLVVQGARGKVGNQLVYRKRGDKTILAKMPEQKPGRKATGKQSEKRDQLVYASLYAQGVMVSDKLRKKYEKKATETLTWHNLACRDFLVAPVVKKVNIKEYTGEPGSRIVIKATDDFRVISVKVKILNADRVLVEEGDAFLDPLNRNYWIYTARQSNNVLLGTKVIATAFDIPNNKGIMEVELG
jgi:hypothetical protein